MINQLSLYCAGCHNHISFQAVSPKDPMITDDVMRQMGFTIIEVEGKKQYYCQKCKNRVPEEYRGQEAFI